MQVESNPIQASEKSKTVKVDKKKEEEEKKRKEYRDKMARLEALQNENLQIMYPEYYKQQ